MITFVFFGGGIPVRLGVACFLITPGGVIGFLIGGILVIGALGERTGIPDLTGEGTGRGIFDLGVCVGESGGDG